MVCAHEAPKERGLLLIFVFLVFRHKMFSSRIWFSLFYALIFIINRAEATPTYAFALQKRFESAVYSLQWDEASKMLTDGKDWIDPSFNDNIAFIKATEAGAQKFVELLAEHPHVNPGALHNEALIQACRNACFNIVQILVAHPLVDPSDRNYGAIFESANEWFAYSGFKNPDQYLEMRLRLVQLLISSPKVDPEKLILESVIHKDVPILKHLLPGVGVAALTEAKDLADTIIQTGISQIILGELLRRENEEYEKQQQRRFHEYRYSSSSYSFHRDSTKDEPQQQERTASDPDLSALLNPECYYAALNIPLFTHDLSLIRQQYVALAKEWHPDKNPHRKETATANMQVINKAYQVLQDSKERLRYDLSGKAC